MRALYVPERFAHGYQALMDDTVASYELGAVYTPGAEGGLLHDDPNSASNWPLPVTAISARDRSFQAASPRSRTNSGEGCLWMRRRSSRSARASSSRSRLEPTRASRRC